MHPSRPALSSRVDLHSGDLTELRQARQLPIQSASNVAGTLNTVQAIAALGTKRQALSQTIGKAIGVGADAIQRARNIEVKPRVRAKKISAASSMLAGIHQKNLLQHHFLEFFSAIEMRTAEQLTAGDVPICEARRILSAMSKDAAKQDSVKLLSKKVKSKYNNELHYFIPHLERINAVEQYFLATLGQIEALNAQEPLQERVLSRLLKSVQHNFAYEHFSCMKEDIDYRLCLMLQDDGVDPHITVPQENTKLAARIAANAAELNLSLLKKIATYFTLDIQQTELYCQIRALDYLEQELSEQLTELKDHIQGLETQLANVAHPSDMSKLQQNIRTSKKEYAFKTEQLQIALEERQYIQSQYESLSEV